MLSASDVARTYLTSAEQCVHAKDDVGRPYPVYEKQI